MVLGMAGKGGPLRAGKAEFRQVPRQAGRGDRLGAGATLLEVLAGQRGDTGVAGNGDAGSPGGAPQGGGAGAGQGGAGQSGGSSGGQPARPRRLAAGASRNSKDLRWGSARSSRLLRIGRIRLSLPKFIKINRYPHSV